MPSRKNCILLFCVFLLCHLVLLLSSSTRSHAQEFQSTNFRALDPVIFPAGYSTSSNFQLHSTISQVATATSSITSFKVSSGFLYFPFVSKPVPTATAGDSQVSLSWTAATPLLGWSVSGYDVGQSTVSGGPYTYSSVGNVLSSTRTGLTNGTLYYFVILPKDTFGNRIATSTQVSATPTAGSTPPPSPSPSPSPGGGGGPIDEFVGPPIVIELPALNEPQPASCRKLVADINCDGKVNLVDFSIMYYWFEKSSVPSRVDLNKDSKVNIFDFSIMAFYWSE